MSSLSFLTMRSFNKTEFPFSEERKNYLMMKFLFGITDPKDNPRVSE